MKNAPQPLAGRDISAELEINLRNALYNADELGDELISHFLKMALLELQNKEEGKEKSA